MTAPIVNHSEATELAQVRSETSNLARCYLDLKAQLERYQRPVVTLVCCAQHSGQAFKFNVYSVAQPARQACPGCEPELFNY